MIPEAVLVNILNGVVITVIGLIVVIGLRLDFVLIED